jgi:myo-inositol-1(or 4)-monophosphatase
VAAGSLDAYAEIGCWPWDVCAGAVIAAEAGALVSGGPDAEHGAPIGEDVLVGQKYIVVIAVVDAEVSCSSTCTDSLTDVL